MFESIRPPTRPNWILRIVILALTVAVATGFVSLWRMTQLPLRPYKGPLPPLTEVQSEVASRLSGHVRVLSATIGGRNVHSAGSFEAITDYLEQNLVPPVIPLQNSRIGSRGTGWPISKPSFLEVRNPRQQLLSALTMTA